MQAQNQEIDHKRVREELKELSPLEIGGLMLSMQSGDGTRFGQKIDPADLPPIPKYDSAESLFKDVERLKTKGESYPRMFELTGRGSQDQYVRGTLQDLEYTLDLGAGKKLSYVWFHDDKGNAEVFLIDDKKARDAAPSVKSEKEPTTGCVEFGSIPDKNLNRQERLPAGTPADEALKVHKQRERDASLIFQNIDPSLSDADAAAIKAERDREISRITPQGDYSDEEYRQYALQAKALDLGLPQYTLEDVVKSTQADLQKQASAIRLGLGRYATDVEIKNARSEINNFVDNERNFADNFPQGTTSSEILKISDQRFKQADLIGANIDPSKTKEEIASIRMAREHRAMELLQSENNVTNPAELEAIHQQMIAVNIGLPEDTNPIVIQQIRERLQTQAIAVTLGLDVNATQEEIDAAQTRSSDYEMQHVPQNVCPVIVPEASLNK